jgi:intron-binding protein aquarius
MPTPTVDQIENDQLTQISLKYWSPSAETTTKVEPFSSKLIDDIYSNELVKTNYSMKRIVMLEFSQYLENYLWKNYKINKDNKSHVLSIVIMVNEKFRERVFAWQCFLDDTPEEFSSLFSSVLKLMIGNETTTLAERAILIKFLDNCVNSLEIDLIRCQVQKICGLPMWTSICSNRRQFEFKNFPKLKKYWKAIEKNDAKLDKPEKEKLNFERTFLKQFLDQFFSILQRNDHNDGKDKLKYLERCLELVIDLESLLPTRRFFNTLLDDSQFVIHCSMSPLITTTRLFSQLLDTIKFYINFEIDDQTGEQKTQAQVQESHYNKLKLLQKGLLLFFIIKTPF